MVTLSFTFDDGNLSQIRDFYPILKKYAFPATFYVVASEIGLPGKLSTDDLRTIVDERNEIGSHGFTHRSLLRLDPVELKNELAGSSEILKPFGAKAFAYPFGHYNSRIASEVARYYDSARTYCLQMAPNEPGSFQRYALSSFSIEGRFRSRIDPQAPQCFLSKKGIIDSDGWFILTLHGRTSLRQASRVFNRANLKPEQWKAYINDARARLSGQHSHILRNLDMLCAHLVHEGITVATVSRKIEQLL